MARSQQPEAGPPLLRTDSMTWDELEAFVDELLERLHRQPGAAPRLVSTSRYGRSGDDQEGIDHFGTYDDGSTETWQDRARLGLGPAAVRKIVEETEVSADRHVIVYSRTASADARKEARRHPGWEIWDQRDLTNKVRALSTHEARALLDNHFGKPVRRLVLPAADTDAFIGLDDQFEPLLTEHRVFHHRADLLGRDDELTLLNDNLTSSGKGVVIVSGPGGRGKSRLVLEALRVTGAADPQRPIVVRAASLPVGSDALNELRGLPAAILLEDAQRDLQGLDAVLNYVRRADGAQAVVTCRPSAEGAVRQAAVTAGFDTSEIVVVHLQPLEPNEARALVRHLADAAGLTLHEDFIEILADEARDCPLVAVVAVSMLASGALSSAALTLDADFRQQILDRFGDVMRTGIPGVTSSQAAETLALIAALSPVRLDDDALLDAMASFLELTRAQVLHRVEALIDHGVLQERQRVVRIVPDVLADESLDAAAVRAGVDTGYVDRLWEAFGDHATSLARNLAELDWRLRSAGDAPDLLGAVWADIADEVIAADAAGRLAALPLLRDLAGPQPTRVADLVEALMAQPATKAERWPGHPLTDDDVRNEMAPILGTCVRTGDEDVRSKALDLQWSLARHDNRPTNPHPDHPLRLLKDVAEFGRPGDTERQDELLHAVQRWLDQPASNDDVVTPLKVLAPLVVKEGTRQQWRRDTNALEFTPFQLDATAVTGLRSRVRDLAVAHGTGGDVRRAVDSVDLMEDALREPTGFFGQEVPEEYVRQWHDDDIATLSALESVARGTDEPLVRLRVRDAVSWVAGFRGDRELAARPRELIVWIDTHDGDLLTAALLGGHHDLVPRGADFLQRDVDPAENDDYEARMQRQADERRAAVDSLWEREPDAAALVRTLRERIETIHRAGRRADGAGETLHAACEALPQASAAIIDAIRDEGAGWLDGLVHLPLDQLRQTNEQAFLERLDELEGQRPDMAAGAVWGFRAHGWLEAVPDSAPLLVRAIAHDSDEVRQSAVFVSGQLVRRSPREAADLLEPQARQRPNAILRSLDDAAGHDFVAWVARLDADERAAVLRLVIATAAWDDWDTGQMLTALAEAEPAMVLTGLVEAVRTDGALSVVIDGLAQVVTGHDAVLADMIRRSIGLPDEERERLAHLMPSVIGSPVTAAGAAALTAVVTAADADELVRLAALVERCESLVPLWPDLVDTMFRRADQLGDQVRESVRRSLARAAIPRVDVGFGDGSPPKISRLLQSARVHAANTEFHEQTRAFYAVFRDRSDS
jgi:hypothetical protein